MNWFVINIAFLFVASCTLQGEKNKIFINEQEVKQATVQYFKSPYYFASTDSLVKINFLVQTRDGFELSHGSNVMSPVKEVYLDSNHVVILSKVLSNTPQFSTASSNKCVPVYRDMILLKCGDTELSAWGTIHICFECDAVKFSESLSDYRILDQEKLVESLRKLFNDIGLKR